MSEELSKDEKRFTQEWMKYNWNDNWGESMTLGFLLGLLERFYISIKRRQASNTEVEGKKEGGNG